MESRISSTAGRGHSSFGPEPNVATKAPSVLLAENDEPMRFVLSSVLRHHGFDVIAVADGLACLDCLETLLSRPIGGTRVDLVLIDLHGPLVNGLELLAQLRRIDWATPVILMSTRDGPEIHQEAARLGPAFIVGRSCDLDDLLTAVSYCT